MGEFQFAQPAPQLLHDRQSFIGGISLYATTPETGEDGVCPSYTQTCPDSCCPDGCCPMGTYCFVNGDYCCPTGMCYHRTLSSVIYIPFGMHSNKSNLKIPTAALW
jgi:hypothetical protein